MVLSNIYFERLNNRYRGPFEKEKLTFLVNEIDKNLNYLYTKVNKQRSAIIGLYDLAENTDIATDIKGNSILETDASYSSGQKVFETNFRNKLRTYRQKVTKESIRDLVVDMQNYLSDATNTMDNGGI